MNAKNKIHEMNLFTDSNVKKIIFMIYDICRLLFDSSKMIRYTQNIKIVEHFTRQTLNLQEDLRKF